MSTNTLNTSTKALDKVGYHDCSHSPRWLSNRGNRADILPIKNEVSQLLRLLTKAHPNCCVFSGTEVFGSDTGKAASVVFPILEEAKEEGDTHWSLIILLPDYEQILYFARVSAADPEKLGKACLLNWLCHLPDSSFNDLGTARDWTAARPWSFVDFDTSDLHSTGIDGAVPIIYFICQTASYPYPPERIDPSLDLADFTAALWKSLEQGEFVGLAFRPTPYNTRFSSFSASTKVDPALGGVPPRASKGQNQNQSKKQKTFVHASIAALAEAHGRSRARLAEWDSHRGELQGYIICSERSVKVTKNNLLTVASEEVLFKIPDLLIEMATDSA